MQEWNVKPHKVGIGVRLSIFTGLEDIQLDDIIVHLRWRFSLT